MKRKCVYVIACFALLAVLAVYAAIAPVASAATPPVWTVGNTWSYNTSYDSGTGVTNTGALNTSVTDASNYTLSADYVPDATRIDVSTGFNITVYSATISLNKANMQYTQQLATIKVNIFGGINDNATITWTYSAPVSGWPLKVGDTYNFTKNTKDSLGFVNKTVNRQGKVLAIESVTVPAGTYNNCFHVVEYDPAAPGTYTYEHWYSDSVGSDVKMIDRDTYKGTETRLLTSTNYVPPNPSTFYFAEGTTRTNFQEYLCLGNSGNTAASAQVTYLFTDGTTKDASYTVPANSRYTVNVNSVVGPNKDLSLKVLSKSPNLVAERPMYFNYNGQWTGGSDAVGATAPNTKWYFAEGNTLLEFDQYITVLNPGNAAANLKFHYMVEGQGEKQVTGQVGPHSRATFKARDQIGDNKNESLYLESDQGVVAERPMYFNYVGLAQNNWTGGHDVVGTNSPNTDWYFAEGTTRKNSVDGAFEEWLCLQNPGTKHITVTATYQLAAGQGDPINKSYTVPAKQRLTVPVNTEIGQDKDCSVYLHSTSDFIAERPMYFSYHAYAWTGGHDVLGVNSTATTWFFAEGTTRSNFEEWLCLQNPGNSDAHTTINYYTTSGQVIKKSWTVKANTRLTVSANSDVGADQDISAKVSSDKPIIVERPMYFDYNGWTGGHDVVGFVPSK